MEKHRKITEDRLVHTLNRIRPLIHGPAAPVKIEAYHVGGEPIPAAEAFHKAYEAFAIGEPWGVAWDTTWFRFSGTIPEDWKGREVSAMVKLGSLGNEGFTAEGLIWQNGVPVRAINVNRADVPLARKACGGEAFQFYIEAAGNPNAQLYGYNLAGNDFGGKPLYVLEQAEICCFNREVFDFYNDFKVAQEAMLALPADAPRRGQLMYALNTSANLFDDTVPATVALARAALCEVLNRHNGDTVHHLSAIGHAHIDTAWLWPLRETIRKCARTFSTALAYMEEYPDYVFCCSQPQHYAWMKEYYPSIFEGIKKAIARGQWEPVGSMWIEADCNLSSGESLIRQILHGKNFFMDEFGIETTDVWIPDVFGYSASMPQIMKKSGVEYFLTQKISWNQFNQFPHQTFWWEGIDGTRIFTHFPPADTYNADLTPKQLAFNVQNFKEHDRATRSLYVYGFGDGGGGPTIGMLETAKRVKNFEGLPKVTLEKVCSFFPKAAADARDLPVWVGELYLELHRGTYTTQARNKKRNRWSEFLLRDAEFFDVVSGAAPQKVKVAPHEGRAVYDVIGKGASDSAGYLDRAWKLLLLNQFHDIIPGSSINRVYRDSEKDYTTIQQLGSAVLEAARKNLIADIDTSSFKQPLVVFNTCSHPRDEVVSLANETPVRVQAPPHGYTVIEGSREHREALSDAPVKVIKSGKEIEVDNGIYHVVFDSLGLITSLFDHRAKREVIAPGERANIFQVHNDYPNEWDAWDVDIFYRETCEDITDLKSLEIVENSELCLAVKIIREFGKSRISQKITFRAGSPRIDFYTRVDWWEDHRLLKVAFPVSVRSPRATYEIQYGHLERPTHLNTSWDMARFEVCAQKWADLSEGDYGVALLNDCKYGHDILGHTIRLSLLRAPTAPDPEADRGHHSFTYALLPHLGDFRQGQVVQEAYALNNPLQIVPAGIHSGSLPRLASFFQMDRPGVVIETIKRAERENAIIVRFYEAYGTRGSVKLRTSLLLKQAFVADLMERTLESVTFDGDTIELPIGPFEIVTLKFLLS